MHYKNELKMRPKQAGHLDVPLQKACSCHRVGADIPDTFLGVVSFCRMAVKDRRMMVRTEVGPLFSSVWQLLNASHQDAHDALLLWSKDNGPFSVCLNDCEFYYMDSFVNEYIMIVSSFLMRILHETVFRFARNYQTIPSSIKAALRFDISTP